MSDSRINVNTIKGDHYGPSEEERKAIKEGEDTPHRIIVGVMQGARAEKTNLGPFHRFMGVFRMRLGNTVFESTEMILPKRSERYLLTLLEEAGEEKRAEGVPFGPLEIWATPEEADEETETRGTPTGYGWRHRVADQEKLEAKLPKI